MTLVEFLQARLAEDEGAARPAFGLSWPSGSMTPAEERHLTHHDPERALAEIEAKRKQIDLCEYLAGWTDKYDWQVTEHEVWAMRMAAQEMLRRLALPYADHPDYQPEWRP